MAGGEDSSDEVGGEEELQDLLLVICSSFQQRNVSFPLRRTTAYSVML